MELESGDDQESLGPYRPRLSLQRTEGLERTKAVIVRARGYWGCRRHRSRCRPRRQHHEETEGRSTGGRIQQRVGSGAAATMCRAGITARWATGALGKGRGGPLGGEICCVPGSANCWGSSTRSLARLWRARRPPTSRRRSRRPAASGCTLALGLNLFRGQHFTAFNQLMAVSIITLIPVLVLFFVSQKYFVQGVTLTVMGGR